MTYSDPANFFAGLTQWEAAPIMKELKTVCEQRPFYVFWFFFFFFPNFGPPQIMIFFKDALLAAVYEKICAKRLAMGSKIAQGEDTPINWSTLDF